MTSLRKTRKLVLSTLYELYLFPQSEKAIAAVTEGAGQEPSLTQIRDSLIYLEKKGYVAITRTGAGDLVSRITPTGVDLVEGAARDRGVLPGNPSLNGLARRKSLRRAILAYCRLFPSSFNGDDEIHAELSEQGIGPVMLDQVRFALWYLGGKELVELAMQPLAGDVAYLARITASGIDLLDGAVTVAGL